MLEGLLLIFFLISIFSSGCSLRAAQKFGKAYTNEMLSKSNITIFKIKIGSIKIFHTYDLILTTLSITSRISSIACLFITGLFVQTNNFINLICPIFISIIFLIILLGDILPFILTSKSATKTLSNSIKTSCLFSLIFLPVSYVLILIAISYTKNRKQTLDPEHPEQTIDAFLQILNNAKIKDKLTPFDKKLIESVLKFKNKIVREVMIPRLNLFCLHSNTSILQAAKALSEEGYSRIPVYTDNFDNIIGVLMFKDILETFAECVEGLKPLSLLDEPISNIKKPVFYTPETKKASQLLQEFRYKKMHLAIVVDEYGGTEGIVTMEDIIEEIVGDIADEYDDEESISYSVQSDGTGWIVDAKMAIDEAEDTFGITIPHEGEYDTIGGHVFHNIGSIPQHGDIIHHDNYTLEVIKASEKNVETIRIKLKNNQ